MLNFDLTQGGGVQILQLSELKEIQAEAYESARSYNKRDELFHNRYIPRLSLIHI